MGTGRWTSLRHGGWSHHWIECTLLFHSLNHVWRESKHPCVCVWWYAARCWRQWWRLGHNYSNKHEITYKQTTWIKCAKWRHLHVNTQVSLRHVQQPLTSGCLFWVSRFKRPFIVSIYKFIPGFLVCKTKQTMQPLDLTTIIVELIQGQGCIYLGWSWSGSMIQDSSDRGA